MLQFTSWVDAVIFVFSLENESSFNAIYTYYTKLSHFRNSTDKEIPIILVGTQGKFQFDLKSKWWKEIYSEKNPYSILRGVTLGGTTQSCKGNLENGEQKKEGARCHKAWCSY